RRVLQVLREGHQRLELVEAGARGVARLAQPVRALALVALLAAHDRQRRAQRTQRALAGTERERSGSARLLHQVDQLAARRAALPGQAQRVLDGEQAALHVEWQATELT